jgi:hypothetical protein
MTRYAGERGSMKSMSVRRYEGTYWVPSRTVRLFPVRTGESSPCPRRHSRSRDIFHRQHHLELQLPVPFWKDLWVAGPCVKMSGWVVRNRRVRRFLFRPVVYSCAAVGDAGAVHLVSYFPIANGDLACQRLPGTASRFLSNEHSHDTRHDSGLQGRNSHVKTASEPARIAHGADWLRTLNGKEASSLRPTACRMLASRSDIARC